MDRAPPRPLHHRDLHRHRRLLRKVAAKQTSIEIDAAAGGAGHVGVEMIDALWPAPASGKVASARMRPPVSALRNRNVSYILRHLVALLHGRTLCDRQIPAFD